MKSFDYRNADDRRQFRLGGERDREGTEDLSAPSFLQIELGADRGSDAAGSGYLITAVGPVVCDADCRNRGLDGVGADRGR